MKKELKDLEMASYIVGGCLVALSIMFFVLYRRRIASEGPYSNKPRYMTDDEYDALQGDDN